MDISAFSALDALPQIYRQDILVHEAVSLQIFAS
jgi:hypothetical protein